MSDDKDTVLNALTREETVDVEKPLPVPEEATKTEAAVEARLEKLTEDKKPVEPEVSKKDELAAEKLAEANDKLKDLLSGK